MKKTLKKRHSELIYQYRFDFFAMVVMVGFIMYYVEVLLRPGQIVFSDIDFPFHSSTYLDEIFGIWNTKWNTTSMLNIPRLLVLLPSYLLAKVAGDNGDLFLKSFVVQNLVGAGLSFYLFCKRLVGVYIGQNFNMSRIFVIIFGSLYYALNPWVIFRIQHIYLLVGYSLFPLILLLFLKVFDHKFQAAAIVDYSPLRNKLYYENVRDIILLAYIITIASAAIHYFFYTVFLLSALLVLLVLKYWIKYRHMAMDNKRAMWLNLFKKTVILGTLLVCFSFYWLFIYIGSILFDVQASQNNINVIDTYVAFSRHSSFKEVVYLISYWWPMIDMRQLSLGFYIGGGMILLTSFLGVIFHAFRHHILLFMGVLSIFLAVFATGVYYPLIAKFFLLMVNFPIIGNMFRDPNKLVALLAIFFGVFFVFGLEWFLKISDRLQRYRQVYIYTIIGVATLCLMGYLMPMKSIYFDHFYAPIEEPQSYRELTEYYEQDNAHYGIYLPVAEEMIQPYSRVATPYWNVNPYSEHTLSKATGDIHIYNSPIPTLFQHEGNDPVISYYFNYIQYLLDQGRTNKISCFLEAFGGDQIIYHDEYLQQSNRQDFNLEILRMDDELQPQFNNAVFTVFDNGIDRKNRDQEFSTIDTIIQTPYGLERTAIYNQVGLYNPLVYPIIYLNQKQSADASMDTIEFNPSGINNIVEARDTYDIVFSMLPEHYYLYPFQWTNQGNVFLGWSKTFLSSVDWDWYLESQDIKDRHFDFDRGKGVAVTFASSHLNIEPYLRDTIKGKRIMDFDTMLRTENLFVSDNPDMFEINSNPYSDINEFQTLHGELIKGDPKDIWQVAKSGVLEAHGKTPYYFELMISGRDVDRLHLKVRFYNEDSEEIGVSYIVAATEESYFDTIQFVGEVISPSETAYMRLDLLSFQNPQYKSYWWIHDINIYDLSQYVQDNTIEGSYEANTAGTHEVFIRTFNSSKGGKLSLLVDEKVFQIETYDAKKNAFGWYHLGQINLEEGQYPVQLTAQDGFNSVNAIVILPQNAYTDAINQVTKNLKKAGIVMSFEPTIDLAYEGNIQSERIYPPLSLGKGVALAQGTIKGEFDVLVSDIYTFNPTVLYVDEELGYGRMTIYKEEHPLVIWDLGERIRYDEQELIIDYTTNVPSYAYSFIDLKTPYRYKENVEYSVGLEPGKYTFLIELYSQTQNQSGLEHIKPFDPSIIQFPIEDTKSNEVGSCERITPDMMREEIKNDMLTITMDPTCSTDWYSYGTQKIDVYFEEEFLIRYDAKSEYLQNRHAKVLFLDDANNFKGDIYINEVEEQYKSQWNHYEQLVKVPKGATQMIIQFLGNGDRKQFSILKIKGFEIYNYNTFITLDHLFVENTVARQLRQYERKKEPVILRREQNQWGVSYTFEEKIEKSVVLNTFLSPNKNWRLGKESYDYLLNGVTQGFLLMNQESVLLKLLLMPGYLVGLGIHLMTLLFCGFWIVKKGKNNG